MPSNSAQPLSAVRVLDLGTGMSAAIAVKILAEAGADITRAEPPAGDPFYEVYPAYRIWHRGKCMLSVASPTESPHAAMAESALRTAAQRADVIVIGGEDYPGLAWRRDTEALARDCPNAIVLDITAAPGGGRKDTFPAVEILAQARSGMCLEQFPDRPMAYALPIATYGAALHGAIAVLAALWAQPPRQAAQSRQPRGAWISASLLCGALRWGASIWAPAERPPKAYFTLTPKGAIPFRLKCGDGGYVQLAPAVPGGFQRLYDLLGINTPPPKPGSQGGLDGPADPRTYFGDVEAVAPFALKWTRDELIAALRKAELPAAPVLKAGETWDDPQAIHNAVIHKDESGWQWMGSPVAIEADVEVPGARDAACNGHALPGPLTGVRVVDFGCFAAGPHSSVLLSDLGADVIKIERIGGDPMRSGYHHYAASNRGKRSICVDAKAPEGAEVIRRICASADLVHHNFRPGVSARMGVDHAALKAVNPDIVVLESSAYGPTGPKSSLPGFDSVFQGLCGHQPGAGGTGNDPLCYRFAPMDYSTGVIGALGMLLGLHLRRRHGRGSAVYASLLNSGLFMLSELVRSPEARFSGAPMNGPEQLGLHPTESLYQTADGWIAVAARGEAMARRFAEVLGADAVTARPCREWGAHERSVLAAALRGRRSDEVLATLKSADVWAEPCAGGIGEVLDDPQWIASGLLLVTQDREYGELRQIGSPVQFRAAPPVPPHLGAVDRLGGHTREIMQECGYSGAEIDDLLARGIVA
jgi:crotonobetainyl-CoA:carnitine CoA-transferase CaiB-like acyl-CoA transferase